MPTLTDFGRLDALTDHGSGLAPGYPLILEEVAIQDVVQPNCRMIAIETQQCCLRGNVRSTYGEYSSVSFPAEQDYADDCSSSASAQSYQQNPDWTLNAENRSALELLQTATCPFPCLRIILGSLTHSISTYIAQDRAPRTFLGKLDTSCCWSLFKAGPGPREARLCHRTLVPRR